MTVKLKFRVTSASKCREGFYLIINGERLHFATRADALTSGLAWIAKTVRVQVCTVREYQQRNRKKIAARMPTKEGLQPTDAQGFTEWVQFAEPWKKASQ